MKLNSKMICDVVNAAYEEEEARIAALDNVTIEIKIKVDKDFDLSAFSDNIYDFLEDEPGIKLISSCVSKE